MLVTRKHFCLRDNHPQLHFQRWLHNNIFSLNLKVFSIPSMVCIPCIVIPVLLYIWHRFFQPVVLKFWNPWKQVGSDSTTNPPTKQSLISNTSDSMESSKTDTSSVSGDESHEKSSNGNTNTGKIKDKNL